MSSYTSTCVVESERHDALRDCIVRLCVKFRPLDGPPAVIRVDPAPGFIALVDDPTLQRLGICLEVGRVKNPVAEKAVLEVGDELLRQEPCGGPVSPLSLAIATAQLNSRICGRGLSAREIYGSSETSFQTNSSQSLIVPSYLSNIILVYKTTSTARYLKHLEAKTRRCPRFKLAT